MPTDSPHDLLVNPDPRVLTVWSDIGCPWATLALHTVHAAARARGVELLVDHRIFPLELFNRQPTPKLILDAEVVQIAAALPELGWRQWRAPEATYPVTILPAMEAVQAAKDEAVGGLVASDELDTALRRAFYAEGRCISIPSVILDIAEECKHVDAGSLADAVRRGAGRAEVYAHWEVAKGPEVQGSPHLYTADGWAAHNPGASYRWTASPADGGLPHLRGYDPSWADALLDRLDHPAR